ncbi:MAG: nucleotidyltransferase family protein [Methanosarcinales archaeon]|nr:nucleotidyltransferase family protein [Methanosarcinales archaeon]
MIDISSELEENIIIIKKFGVRRIGLFGSAVRGELTKESDVDLLVEFEEECENFSNLINLYFFLQNLLHRKIDLVTTDSISPYFNHLDSWKGSIHREPFHLRNEGSIHREHF